jgi:hypothetical protein
MGQKLANCPLQVLASQQLGCPINSFETRTGPVGRPGTRPTRAWNRSEFKQKPAWKLARQNPVDPAGQPGTRVNPAETWPSFFYICINIKRRRFGLLKSQNDEDEWCTDAKLLQLQTEKT